VKRVRLIHWNREEAQGCVRLLKKGGFEVEFDSFSRDTLRRIGERLPDAIVIDLGRLPSQGRDIGLHIRKTKATRQLPLVFVGGLAEKGERIRQHFPAATFTTWDHIQPAIEQAIANPPVDPLVPESVFAGYKDTPLAKKLGIKDNSTVMLINAPEGVEGTLGKLPKHVQLKRAGEDPRDITLWFVRTQKELMQRIEEMIPFARDGGLWILWPKKRSGVESDVTQNIVRKVGLESGLVDYKISSFDEVWSGLRFTQRKPDR